MCIIFHNGDSACFQLNAAGGANATRYVNDTAKDIDDTPLHAEGGIGGGGSGVGVERDRPSTPFVTFGGGGGGFIVCTYQGGVLSGCYVEML